MLTVSVPGVLQLASARINAFVSSLNALSWEYQWVVNLQLSCLVGMPESELLGQILIEAFLTAATTEGPLKRKALACLWVVSFGRFDIPQPDETIIESLQIIITVHLGWLGVLMKAKILEPQAVLQDMMARVARVRARGN